MGTVEQTNIRSKIASATNSRLNVCFHSWGGVQSGMIQDLLLFWPQELVYFNT